MTDRGDTDRTSGPLGCLAAGAGAAALAALAPIVLAIRSWRTWRRGSDVRAILEVEPLTSGTGNPRRRLDLSLDIPLSVETGFQRRLTDTVVRVAETLRASDDVYHLVYRLPWAEEPVALPVGPQLQELGDRFSLVQSQGAMTGRTVVWLTLGRDRALSEVVDPITYDPEAGGEPDGLMVRREMRWSMATAWARSGPSLEVRVIFVVPEEASARVAAVLEKLS